MSKVRRWFRKLGIENQSIKTLSVVLAVLTWYSIRGIIGITTLVQGIPITVSVTGDNIIALPQSHRTVAVTFQGSQEDIASLQEEHVRAQIRAVASVKAQEGARNEEVIPVRIHPRNIEGAKGVRAIKVKPSSITVRLEKESERFFLVKVNHDEPSLGQVKSVVCDPPSVRIRGPKRVLDALEAQNGGLVVETEMIKVRDATKTFAKTARVLPPSAEWVPVIEPAEVLVTVTVEAKPASRRYDDVPVVALIRPGPAVSVELRPTKVAVTLNGRKEVLEKLTKNDIRVFVDCEGLALSATYDGLELIVSMVPKVDVVATVEPPRVQAVLKEAL